MAWDESLLKLTVCMKRLTAHLQLHCAGPSNNITESGEGQAVNLSAVIEGIQGVMLCRHWQNQKGSKTWTESSFGEVDKRAYVAQSGPCSLHANDTFLYSSWSQGLLLKCSLV